jgi:hypothetical protein
LPSVPDLVFVGTEARSGRLFSHRWLIDQADETDKLFDRQVDGKGVFMI